MIGSAARIFSMQSLYQRDLAYVQAAAFGSLAQGAVTEIIADYKVPVSNCEG